jgi:glutamate/aspartate transport system substrate-binding protein
MKMHALIVASLLAIGGAAQADTLSKIKDSGVLSMGVRESSGALSYALGDGKYGGFHVELCEWVAAGVKSRMGLPRLDIKYQPVTPHNRIALVRSGAVDLECGATVNTSARQREVSFALTTYAEEVRMGGKVVAVEPIAIMLRKDDPAFKSMVDDVLRAMMRSGDIADLHHKWFVEPIPPSNMRMGLVASEATRTAWAYPNDRPVEAYGHP